MTRASSQTPPEAGGHPMPDKSDDRQLAISRLLEMQSLYRLIGDQSKRIDVPHESGGKPSNMPIGTRYEVK
jgi:hypothetical protein